MRARRYTIQAVIYSGDEGGYVAECLDLAVVTQGRTMDETVQNLREAIQLHLEGEDPLEMGLAPNPPVLITLEMEPVYA
jgi:predicted RNase H-like HicB family nuclease